MCGTNHKVKIVFGHCCGGMTCGWAEVGPVVVVHHNQKKMEKPLLSCISRLVYVISLSLLKLLEPNATSPSQSHDCVFYK
ncbi:transmembrane protein, putative [Medicago truncatula]|uniref:Transmembrane protein, putative n=1 Tax=Medicago truncatula TaxID=3880 RepID=G7K361_MEDTR|nr:transmembrane protein, putative [Medicago truncatula]